MIYARVVVTMGCGEICPSVVGPEREDWPLPDPKGEPVERVREIRDIRGRVEKLVEAQGWGRRAGSETAEVSSSS